MFKSLEEYTSKLKNTNIEQIITDLGHSVKVMYDRTVKSDGSGRIMLTAQRYNSRIDFNNPIVQVSGGIIIEYGTWKILAMPPYPANPRVKLSIVDASEYTVREINDGTMLTLYFYQNEWHLASTNGISVGSLVWMGKKTYREVLDECLAAFNAESNNAFSWDNLNKSCSYTIGFRHPEYHPFRPSTEVWFIQSYDTTTNVISHTSEIGIKEQKIIELNMKELLNNCSNASESFMANGTVNFGYVLRHKTKPMGRFSNIIIESSMMKLLKTFVYNDNEGRLNPRLADYVGSANRLKYVAIKSYLDMNYTGLFIKLFPQYQNIHKVVRTFIEKLASAIKKPADDPYSNVIAVVTPYIIEHNKINLKSKIKEEILRDFLRNVAFTDTYYDYLIQNDLSTV